MDKYKEENIEDLFGAFLDSEKAGRAAEDVRRGEQILLEHPAPEPGGELTADIKTNITKALMRKRTNVFRKSVYKAAAIAAVIIILAVVSVKLFDKEGGKPELTSALSTTISEAIWEGEDITVDDADFVMLTAEIEQIEDALLSLRSGDDGDNGDINITELETELSEIDNDFWKG